jgi:hypothetical protein
VTAGKTDKGVATAGIGNPLYHPVSSVPVVTIRGMAGDQAPGAGLVRQKRFDPIWYAYLIRSSPWRVQWIPVASATARLALRTDRFQHGLELRAVAALPGGDHEARCWPSHAEVLTGRPGPGRPATAVRDRRSGRSRPVARAARNGKAPTSRRLSDLVNAGERLGELDPKSDGDQPTIPSTAMPVSAGARELGP